MRIEKEKHFFTQRKSFFIKGHLNIEADYFIKSIDKGVEKENNKSYQTNINGKMTSWNYFVQDPIFYNTMIPVLNLIDTLPVKKLTLTEAWGFITKYGENTNYHDHASSFLSVAIYLNEHSQCLKFKSIDEEVKCFPGSFALFSSHLEHGTERNVTKLDKYGLSANLYLA